MRAPLPATLHDTQLPARRAENPAVPPVERPPLVFDEFPSPTARARSLRRRETDAERRLWQRLRNHQLGARFRRQHPLAGVIVDFCCVRGGLVIELDGDQHGEPEAGLADARRDERLRRLGFRVARFTNREVLLATEAVIETIRALLLVAPSPSRLPSAPGEEISALTDSASGAATQSQLEEPLEG